MFRSSCNLWTFILVGLVASQVASQSRADQRWVIEDLLAVPTPFAIGHRGSGSNLGEDPDRPLENTRASVREAFKDGIHAVEVDVQITADGQVVGFHDDFLSDLSCINGMTFQELKAEIPEVSLLKHILNRARAFSHSGGDYGPSGLMIVEMKAPSPLCDPDDVTEYEYVAAVVDMIQNRNMEEQVLLESFSPTLLAIAADLAPEIERELAVNILQFLTPEEVEAATGLPVTIIAKNDFGLQWAEIGQFFRLPGYVSIEHFLGISLAVGSRAVSIDFLILAQAELTVPGSGTAIVDAFHSFGLPVMVYTLNTADEWFFVEAMGVDGIFTDDIPLGLALQP